MQKKLISALLTAGSILLAPMTQASEVKWADPLPNTAAVAADAAKGIAAKAATGGLGYEWWVNMGAADSAEFVGAVGAKSSYEPTFAVNNNPDFLWTHTSNWVALELTADANVTITVSRQQGVQVASLDTKTDPAAPKLVTTHAGNLLYPVVSVYKNWEENGEETHQSNPIGRAKWQKDLDFLGIAYADMGATTVTYKGKLAKGKYTLNIGGANGWAGNGCASTNAACYTGNHGYRATITTTAN